VRRTRNERELLAALQTAALVRGSDAGAALRQSFAHAVQGLDADKGLVLQVLEADPPQVEILCARGLTPESEAAAQVLQSSPGISASVIRQTLETGEPQLLPNSQAARLDQATSQMGEAYSVICAAVVDTLTHVPIAILYFQDTVQRAFEPYDLDWVMTYAVVLGGALTLYASAQRERQDQRSGWKRSPDVDIIGSSAATRGLIERLNACLPSASSPNPPPILVTGETGTGKDLVARFVHHYSKRARGPLVSCNCSGLRGELAESRFFGHVKGAFTGAVNDARGYFRAADKGVLFLDEIANLPYETQGVLLRVLQEHRVQALGDTREVAVDIQLVVATNRQLEAEVAEGRFREDLFYRLNALRIELMPLRDPSRIADIKPLLAHHLAKEQRRLGKRTGGLTPQALRALLRFAWPGNVRDVENICAALVVNTPAGAEIGIDIIEKHCRNVLSGRKNPNPEAVLEDEDATWAELGNAFRARVFRDRADRLGDKAAIRSLAIAESTFYRHVGPRTKRPR